VAVSGVAAAARSLPELGVIDRLVRGRAWIPVLGVMLAGIVAMQVAVLKMGAGLGRAIQQGTALEATNEQLQQNVATLSDDQRIERLAAGMGMVMPPAEAVGFLSAGGQANTKAALANIHQPDSTSFLYSTANDGYVITRATLAAAQGAFNGGQSSAVSSTGATAGAGTQGSSDTSGTSSTTSGGLGATGVTGGAGGTGTVSGFWGAGGSAGNTSGGATSGGGGSSAGAGSGGGGASAGSAASGSGSGATSAGSGSGGSGGTDSGGSGLAGTALTSGNTQSATSGNGG